MKFRKNLTFVREEIVRKKDALIHELLVRPLEERRSFEEFQSALANVMHVKEGAHMWVSQDVSDDLEAADWDLENISIEDIEWPNNRLEIYFQDPALPTILCARTCSREVEEDIESLTGIETREIFDGIRTTPDREFIYFQLESKGGVLELLICWMDEADEFAVCADEFRKPEKITGEGAPGLPPEEATECLRESIIMFYKVMMFATSVDHSFRVTRDNPTKKEGGKPGFRNRPKTDRLIVEYLPKHLEERRAAREKAGRGSGRKFRGRRGHWRHFRSERFKNVQGTKKFIYPIPGSDGKVPRKKFVVRRPS